MFGRYYTPVPSYIDERSLHLIYRDEPQWSELLRVLKQPRELSLAWRLFLYCLEEAAYAHLFYGHGSVTWENFWQVYNDVELADILLRSYIRLMNYSGECVSLAVEEMRASNRLWLPILAETVDNGGDFNLLAYQAWLFIHRNR